MMYKIWTISFLFFYVCVAQDDYECPSFVTRNKWSSKVAKNVNYLLLPIPYVVIHHTVTPECTSMSQCSSLVDNIRSYHMDIFGWHDIGFSFLIGGDGKVYEGCGWNREGAHTFGYNKRAVGIAFIGNFQEKPASDIMMQAAHKLITCGKSQEILSDTVRVIGAKQVTNTRSPGFVLYGQIQDWPEWVSQP